VGYRCFMSLFDDIVKGKELMSFTWKKLLAALANQRDRCAYCQDKTCDGEGERVKREVLGLAFDRD